MSTRLTHQEQGSLDEHAREIRRLGRRSFEDVVEIGRRLHEAKTILGRGLWEPWLDAELKLSRATADRYIQIHANRANLLRLTKLDLPVSSLYGLHVSDEFVEKITDRIEAGEGPSPQLVRAVVQESKVVPLVIKQSAPEKRVITVQVPRIEPEKRVITVQVPHSQSAVVSKAEIANARLLNLVDDIIRLGREFCDVDPVSLRAIVPPMKQQAYLEALQNLNDFIERATDPTAARH